MGLVASTGWFAGIGQIGANVRILPGLWRYSAAPHPIVTKSLQLDIAAATPL